ncbi:MAG: glutamyl-tRNA reductase [Polyangiaceae bacterium]
MSVITVVGLSHRTAPVDVRERFAARADILPEVLARLASERALDEALFLSTCNRVEVLAAATHENARDAIVAVMAAHAQVSPGEIEPFLYEKRGDEAVRHIFRVAASLDSMVLGEPQILGQVKDAYDAAVAAGTLRNYLGRCVHRAFSVAKKVRSETAIGEGLVSIASVAVDLAKRIFGDLSDHNVLLIGAGEMAEQAAKSLGRGGKRIHVVNRSFDRGKALAETVGGRASEWKDLEAELAQADVVVASAGAQDFIVTHDMMKRVTKARKNRTLFFIDIAVPRNVDPRVHGSNNVYVFNVDDLEEQVAEGLKSRQGEARAAEKLVEHELEDFRAWAKSLDVKPTIVALRAKTRAVLIGELERSLEARLRHLPEGDRAALTQMMESAINKLLHAPTSKLKAAASMQEGADLATALQALFDLPEVSPTPSKPELDDAPAEEDDERVTH